MEGPVGIVEHSSEIMSGGATVGKLPKVPCFGRSPNAGQNRGALAHSLGFEQMICMQYELRRIKICFTKQDIYGIVNSGYNIEGI